MCFLNNKYSPSDHAFEKFVSFWCTFGTFEYFEKLQGGIALMKELNIQGQAEDGKLLGVFSSLLQVCSWDVVSQISALTL